MTLPNNIQYRKAIHEDIDTLSRLHLITFEHSLGASVGINYLKAFFKWFVANDSTIVIVCHQSEKIIGYAIGAVDGYSRELTKAILPNILLGLLSHPKSIFHPNFIALMNVRIRNLFNTRGDFKTNNTLSIPTKTNKTPFVLVGIGVDPEFRKQNLGTKLLNDFENEVWCRSFSKIRLTVYKSNTQAINFYEKAKWVLDSENETMLKYVKIRCAIT